MLVRVQRRWHTCGQPGERRCGADCYRVSQSCFAQWTQADAWLGPMTPVQFTQIRGKIGAGRISSRQGLSEEIDPLPDYMQTMLGRSQCLNGGGRRVVLDAGNGAWSEIAPEIFRRLGFRCYLYFMRCRWTLSRPLAGLLTCVESHTTALCRGGTVPN
jgi:hypothetical protein